MTNNDFFKWYDILSAPVAGSHDEALRLCDDLRLTQLPQFSEIIAGNKFAETCTPGELLDLIETMYEEYSIIKEKYIIGKVPICKTFEVAARVRDAKKQYVEEIFIKALLMKLLRNNFSL